MEGPQYTAAALLHKCAGSGQYVAGSVLVSQCDEEVVTPLAGVPVLEKLPVQGGRQALCIPHLEHGKCHTEYLQAVATDRLDR